MHGYCVRKQSVLLKKNNQLQSKVSVTTSMLIYIKYYRTLWPKFTKLLPVTQNIATAINSQSLTRLSFHSFYTFYKI